MLEPQVDVRRDAAALESLDGGGVTIQGQQQAAGPQALEQRPRVTSAPQGGVDERLPRGGSKAVYYLL